MVIGSVDGGWWCGVVHGLAVVYGLVTKAHGVVYSLTIAQIIS